MSDYTPTTEHIANIYECGWDDECDSADVYEVRAQARKEFYAWLAAHDAEVRAAAPAEQGETRWEYGVSWHDGDERIYMPVENAWRAGVEVQRMNQGYPHPEENYVVRREVRESGPWLPVPTDDTNAVAVCRICPHVTLDHCAHGCVRCDCTVTNRSDGGTT